MRAWCGREWRSRDGKRRWIQGMLGREWQHTLFQGLCSEFVIFQTVWKSEVSSTPLDKFRIGRGEHAKQTVRAASTRELCSTVSSRALSVLTLVGCCSCLTWVNTAFPGDNLLLFPYQRNRTKPSIFIPLLWPSNDLFSEDFDWTFAAGRWLTCLTSSSEF